MKVLFKIFSKESASVPAYSQEKKESTKAYNGKVISFRKKSSSPVDWISK